jgi:hypothetical protein
MEASIPFGYSRSRFEVTSDEHAGLAVVTSGICLMAILVFASVFIVNWNIHMRHISGRRYDAFIAATVVSQKIVLQTSCTKKDTQTIAIPQSILVISAAYCSLGKPRSVRREEFWRLDLNVTRLTPSETK